jgi:uncharacterized protein HemY
VENGLKCLAIAALLATSASPVLAHGAHSFLMQRVDERLALDPESADLWFQRAVLEFEHEDWSSAATDFAKVEHYAPGKFPVLWWQGRVLENQGKTSRSESRAGRLSCGYTGSFRRIDQQRPCFRQTRRERGFTCRFPFRTRALP